MTSSVIAPAIITLLLAGYIAALVYFIIMNHGQKFPSYKDCRSYSCGNSTIQFPFGGCGILSVDCSQNQPFVDLRLQNLGTENGWTVLGDITDSSYRTRTLQITPSNGFISFGAATLDYDWLIGNGFFILSPAYNLGTILACTQSAQLLKDLQVTPFECEESIAFSTLRNHCFFFPSPGFSIAGCTSFPIVFPTDKTYNISADKNLDRLQQTGFQITWPLRDDCQSCADTRGRCYFDDSYFDYNFYSNYSNYSNHEFSCICRTNDVRKRNCTGISIEPRMDLGILAAVFSTQCGAFIIVVVSCVAIRRRCCCERTASDEEQTILEFMDPLDSRSPSVENFLHYYSSLVPTRYSYGQIRAYTNNLADQLGKGGFGTVYKGKLPGGAPIAIKILDESKHSEQQFIAEVATVGRTYHVNLVRLLGYCSEGSKRALVYEYMVNGSLDRYVHGDPENQLDWKLLYSIALGTARGIAYLHDECRNKILHCDIKPHNVLLDANFLPKVADFGLAKMSNKEESHISIAHGGTKGYAAPEMWSRMYGVVTDRSDVYSYGMLIMEMVGGRKNTDFQNKESGSSKFFYPEWAFKQVQKGEFGNLREGNMSVEEEVIAKKLCLVGLWCIQFHASRRPRMSKVIQMLEGDVEITPPPIPFPVDTPPIPITGIFSCDQSSSPHSLEVAMTDPKNREIATISSQ